MLPAVEPIAGAAAEKCGLCAGRHRTELRADGRRMLRLEEVAAHLNCSVPTVRKLIHLQAAEDKAAGLADRPPAHLGLRATSISAHCTRVKESEVVRLLER